MLRVPQWHPGWVPRPDVIAALEEFVRSSPPSGANGGPSPHFDNAIHWLIDDTWLDETPTSRAIDNAYLFRTDAEAIAVQAVVDHMLRMIGDLGDVEPKKYVERTDWSEFQATCRDAKALLVSSGPEWISTSERFAVLGANGQLAAALETSEEISARHRLRVPDLVELFEHLWAWMAVGEENFAVWHEWSNPALDVGLGGEMPSSLADACQASGLDGDDVRRWVRGLVDIVYGQLFFAFDKEILASSMQAVFAMADALGVVPPDPARYEPFGLVADGDWGPRMTAAEIEALRARPRSHSG